MKLNKAWSILSLFFIAILASSTNICAMDQGQQSSDTEVFWCALWNKDFEYAQELLAGGVDANTTNHKGETPLIEATTYGNRDTIEFLLSQPNINLEAVNGFGMTAVQLAVEMGVIDIAQFLISRGASATQIDFAELYSRYKKDALSEEQKAGDMGGENYANYYDRGHEASRAGKRTARFAHSPDQSARKRGRVAPEEEPFANGEEYGAEPEFANGAQQVHDFGCFYNYSQDSYSQGNSSQEDKENTPPAEGFVARHAAQSPALLDAFMCPICTAINDRTAERCSACGVSTLD